MHRIRSFLGTVLPSPRFVLMALGLAILALAVMAGAADAALLLAAPPAALVAKRNELDAKRKELHDVFEAAGPDLDFNAADVLDKLGAKDSAEAVEKVRAINKEIKDLHDESTQLAELDGIRAGLQGVDADLDAPATGRHTHPGRDETPRMIGDVIVGSDAFEAYRETGNPTRGEVEGFGLRDIRATLFETGAGWEPESVRSGRVVEAATRPIQVIDIIPMGRTSQAAYVYMEETTRTHDAEETAEGGTYAESTFELTEQSSPVRKITDSIPVTDEQLEDVEGVRDYLNGRLTFGLRQRFDGQVLDGDGNAPNLEGILNVSGIQTQAKGSDPVPDAFYKAGTKIRVTGRAFPTHSLLHPNDWQDIRLLRTADGIYIWGSPSEAGPERLWGLPVVQTDILSEGTGLVGAFDPAWITAFERRGIDVQVGFVDAQFKEGKRTIRADFRVALVIFRPAAFA
ncbi:MAG: phage major capsid protein, partial [Gemmatimonadota bacterium]